MKNLQSLAISLTVAAALLLAACSPQSPTDTQSSQPQVAVIDLGKVAQDTGQDIVIRDRAEAGIAEINNQLQQLAADLDEQLTTERDKIGVAPNEQEAARLQQLRAQARQQVNQAQMQAQQQANDLESQLVLEFREELMPLAEKIASDRGLKLILSKDIFIFWADDAIDITADVVAAWQAQVPELEVTAPDGETAESPAAEAESASEVVVEANEDTAQAATEAAEAATEAAESAVEAASEAVDEAAEEIETAVE